MITSGQREQRRSFHDRKQHLRDAGFCATCAIGIAIEQVAAEGGEAFDHQAHFPCGRCERLRRAGRAGVLETLGGIK